MQRMHSHHELPDGLRLQERQVQRYEVCRTDGSPNKRPNHFSDRYPDLKPDSRAALRDRQAAVYSMRSGQSLLLHRLHPKQWELRFMCGWPWLYSSRRLNAPDAVAYQHPYGQRRSS
jgi:hypothetical protein